MCNLSCEREDGISFRLLDTTSPSVQHRFFATEDDIDTYLTFRLSVPMNLISK